VGKAIPDHPDINFLKENYKAVRKIFEQHKIDSVFLYINESNILSLYCTFREDSQSQSIYIKKALIAFFVEHEQAYVCNIVNTRIGGTILELPGTAFNFDRLSPPVSSLRKAQSTLFSSETNSELNDSRTYGQ